LHVRGSASFACEFQDMPTSPNLLPSFKPIGILNTSGRIKRDVHHRACGRREASSGTGHAAAEAAHRFRRTAMIRNFSSILGAVGLALAVAVCLLATVGTGKAEQPGGRSGDPFCFCSGSMVVNPPIADSMRNNARA
jgi:hypothetical protein